MSSDSGLLSEDWKCVKEILLKFESNENGVLSYEMFTQLCEKVFDSQEAKENGERYSNIFREFDLNGDGVLDALEWKRCYEKWICPMMNPTNVLLVVDVQNDFIDGSLSLRDCGSGQDGAEVVPPINRLIREGLWHKVIYSFDWHPDDHISFYENLHMRDVHPESKVSKEMAEPFDEVLFVRPRVKQKLWPKHCLMDSWGAELHKDLMIPQDATQVFKGKSADVEEYSAFDAHTTSQKSLGDILSSIGATNVFVCGLAYDVCVRKTCLDALSLGYPLAVIEDCCRGIDLNDIEAARCLISKEGGLVTNSRDVLAMINEGKRSLVMAEQLTKTKDN